MLLTPYPRLSLLSPPYLLPPEAGVDGHDEHVVHEVEDVLDHLGGSVRVEGDRGAPAAGADGAASEQGEETKEEMFVVSERC